jgi:hypothetical protein
MSTHREFNREPSMKVPTAILGWGLILAAGCASGGIYPDTDVCEPAGFELKIAPAIQKSAGQMQSGTLEYAGAGNLVQVYRSYLEAMKLQGWTVITDDIQGQKAVGSLRKDSRTCGVEVTDVNGQIRVVVKVGATK